MNTRTYVRSLDIAAMQFKLALQIDSAAHAALVPGFEPLPQRLAGMTYAGLSINKKDLALSPDDAALASNALQHCATFTLGVAIDSAFEQSIPDRFNSPDADIVVAARIARILRNAFTHDPFFPRWLCTNPNHLDQFEIPEVIAIDTTIVNGMDVKWQHYGGPLAILRFLRHCQGLLLARENAT